MNRNWDVPKADAYGGVLIDGVGKVLLREPANHFGGYWWTFAKGRADQGETPAEAALREVLEETGQAAEIVAPIPKLFPGTTSSTAFFLMRPVGPPREFGSETAQTRWVSATEARSMIGKTKTKTGRERDLAILDASMDLWLSYRIQG